MTAQLDCGRLISHADIQVTGPMTTDSDYKETEVSVAQSCRDCLFAETVKNKQTNCKFDRLRKYAKTTDVTYVEKRYEEVGVLSSLFPEFFDESLSLKDSNKYVLAEYHDGELVKISNFEDEANSLHECAYAVINDRYCNLHRNKYSEWANGQGDTQAKARAEISLRASVLVYFDGTHSVEDLRASIQSCLEQQLKPVQIIVLNNQNDIAVSEVIKQMLAEYPNIAWTNSRSLWGDADVGLCVDDALGQNLLIGSYFLLIHAGTVIKNDLISELDISLNDKLERWMCLTDKNVFVVQTKLAKVLDGYQEVKPVGSDSFIYGLENKIKWFADKTNKSYFVKELVDVFKS